MRNFIYIFVTALIIVVLSIFLFQSFSEKKEVQQTQSISETTFTKKPPVIEKPKTTPILSTNPGISPVYPAIIPPSPDFCGEEAPMDIFYIREYLDRELTVNTYFHSSTSLLLKKSKRWFPIIEPILAKNNIPDDFKYLALIESGFANVTSPAGAKGFWQFLKHTAREHGLEVNSSIDERYNVEKSTVAACSYLNESYEIFNNWTLVASAYNAGNRRITEGLEKQKVDSYYELLLNKETARYIFRILAIKTIFENQKTYGFHIKDSELYPPIPTKKIKVTKTISDLVSFANNQSINYKTLKYFNPWLLKDHLPNRSRRSYYIKIPVDGNISYSKITNQLEAFADTLKAKSQN